VGQKSNRVTGFTIVELLIVIVVIGILATLVIVTFTGVQQKSRNTKRQTDLVALDGYIEASNGQYGFYPTMANLNDATFRATMMQGLDPSALQDPTGSAQLLVATPQAGAYAYVASPANCDNSATLCTSFVLTATLEGGGVYTKQSN
jgi:prepilin-type N-terminal cleavage/methylation domain-containing protein